MIRRVYVDYDDTLNNLNHAWMAWIEQKFGVKLTTEMITSYDYVKNTLGDSACDFWRTPGNYRQFISLHPGAAKFFWSLQCLFGKDNVFVLTSTPSKEVEIEKTEVASSQLEIPPEMVVHASDKWVHTKDSLIVDDWPVHIINHIDKNRRPGILFDRAGRYGWSKLDRYPQFSSRKHGK